MTQNSPKRYHPLLVTLHWLVVILVIALFVIGKSMSRLPNDAEKLTPLALHMGVGILTLVVIVFRFVMRMRLPKPAHASTGNAFGANRSGSPRAAGARSGKARITAARWVPVMASSSIVG